MSLLTRTPMPTDGQEDSGSRDAVRRHAVLAGAGAVVVALGGVLVLPHLLGGRASTATATAAVAPAARPATASTPGASPTTSGAPSAPALTGPGRNPFAVPPQFRPRAASPTPGATHAATVAPPAATGSPSSDAVPSTPFSPTAPPVTVVTTPPVAHATARPAPPVWVRLVSVSSDNSSAVVRVGTRSLTTRPGHPFAGGFRLLRLEAGRCGTVAYGSDHFDLCAGSAVLVPARPPR